MQLLFKECNGRSRDQMKQPSWCPLYGPAKTQERGSSEMDRSAFCSSDTSKSTSMPRQESWFDPWKGPELKQNHTSASHQNAQEGKCPDDVGTAGAIGIPESAASSRQESWFDPWKPKSEPSRTNACR